MTDSQDYLQLDHLFMLTPGYLAFELGTKTWVHVHIDNTSEIKPDDALPEALIDKTDLKLIYALTEYQTQRDKPWSADYIKNKGKGVIPLLHGPPGVGKTYTVETVALRTNLPLIVLTIAEIGVQESKVESELRKWFTLAEQWHAILLIDECDIFLERRNYTDISRNGVVAAFLRKVEYFSGLLFLTTNRIGLIDEAFMSRVHAVISFQRLDETRRGLIWKSLLEKLSRERKGEVVIGPSALTYLSSKEMLEMDWNGREIRNAFQMAFILAEHEAKQNPYHQEGSPIIIEADQFKLVRKTNQTFRDYLTSIRQEGPLDRAMRYYGRNDAFRIVPISMDDK